MTDTTEQPQEPVYNAETHRASFRQMRGEVSLADIQPKPAPTAPASQPTVGDQSHREHAYRGGFDQDPRFRADSPLALSLRSAAGLTEPDPRSPAVREFDSRYGAAPDTKYDFDLRSLETKDGSPAPIAEQIAFENDLTVALKATNWPRSAGNSFAAEVLSSNREYRSLPEADRAAWSAKQDALMAGMPNAAALIADAKIALSMLQEHSPAIAKVVVNGLSFQAVIALALQAQRLEVRSSLGGTK